MLSPQVSAMESYVTGSSDNSSEKTYANSVVFYANSNSIKIGADNSNRQMDKAKKSNSLQVAGSSRPLGKCTSELLMQRLRRKRVVVRQRLQMEFSELMEVIQRL